MKNLTSKILRVTVLGILINFLTACPNAAETSFFIRNYYNSETTVTFRTSSKPIFAVGKQVWVLNEILPTKKLIPESCKKGNELIINQIDKGNQFSIPARSTGEITFPLYKMIKFDSEMVIEIECNGKKEVIESSDFEKRFKNRKEVYYLDIE